VTPIPYFSLPSQTIELMTTILTDTTSSEVTDVDTDGTSTTGNPHDERNIKESFLEARKATSNGCMPFGAILANTRKGTILARASNVMPAFGARGGSITTCDPTGHAEMTLLRSTDLMALSKEDRLNATLYSSTEPCVMCAGGIYWAGIGRVVYGCSAIQLEEQVSGPGGFDIPIQQLYGLARPGSRRIDIAGPVLSEEAIQIHKDSGVWNHFSTTQQAANQDIAVEASLKTSGLGSADAKDDNIVPVIDLSNPNIEDVQQQLWDAATNVGFFSVIGHGIDLRKIDAAFEESANFFQQPLEEKTTQSPLDMKNNCGFEYFSQVRPSTGVADQKESLQVTAREGGMDGRWPNPTFQNAATTLLEDSHQLANRILELLQPLAVPPNAESADTHDPHLISKSHTLWAPDGQCTLRFLHYPPMDNDTTTKLLADGYWRAGPHTGE
jgi:tRNA(Arg) A34 adenosine deaminase TadA